MGNSPTTGLIDPQQHPNVAAAIQAIQQGLASFGEASQNPTLGLERTRLAAQIMAMQNEAGYRNALLGAGQQRLGIQQENAETAQGRLTREDVANMINAAKAGQTITGGPSDPTLTPAAPSALSAQQNADLAKTGANIANLGADTNLKNTQAANIPKKLDEQIREFNATDKYRTWKENLDTETKLRVADLTQNKAPAATVESAIYADGANKMLDQASSIMDTMEKKGVLGNIPANKMENYLFSKGLADPSWDENTKFMMGQLRSALEYTSSATMRAHTGRTSQEIYEDFKTMLGPNQSWAALRGALQETNSLMSDYKNAAATSYIRGLRSGAGSQPQPTPANKVQAPNSLLDSLVKKHGG